MNKIAAPLMAGLLLLTGCQNTEPNTDKIKPKSESSEKTVNETNPDQPFPYPSLLAENDQSYSLLIVGNQDEGTPIEENETLRADISNILSLPERDMVEKIYPNLHIKKKTAFIVFDHKGVVHESPDVQELTNYLAEHPAK